MYKLLHDFRIIKIESQIDERDQMFEFQNIGRPKNIYLKNKKIKIADLLKQFV
jgi:hypothetical protein